MAQPVAGRKVSENRGLYGNRIPSIVKHHTGGSTGSTGSTGASGDRSEGKKDVPEASQGSVPPPRDRELPTSADLDENAVDLSATNERAAVVQEPEEQGSSTNDSQDADTQSSRPPIPEIRAEDLVPSTLPRDDDHDVSSDVSEPPSPRSTAAQASGTPQSMSSAPGLERITSQLSLADSAGGSNLSVAGSQATYSSLRVETGAADDESMEGSKADGSRAEEDEARRNISEEQDNLSDVSTPTGTPKMAQREYLPEIPGSQSHPIGGLSLHPDGTVSPAAFGTGRKGSLGLDHMDEVMVDTSALPNESQKLKHENQINEKKPDVTETEKNRKGNEPTSQGDFEITEDKMVHIELPEDDPALTEEGRELQRTAKEKLHAQVEKKGKSEWEVMEDNSEENKPEEVKREQESANQKETGDPMTSFEYVHEQKVKEAYSKGDHSEEKAVQDSEIKEEPSKGKPDDTVTPTVQTKDFGAAASTSTEHVAETTAKIPSDGDKGDEPESPLSNEDREHLSGPTDNTTTPESPAKDDSHKPKSEELKYAEKAQTVSDVLQPPTTQSPEALDPASQRSLDKTLAEAPEDQTPIRVGQGESDAENSKQDSAKEDVEIQDIEDIPIGDDTELHKKDQDPNVESLIAGKSNAEPGVEPELEITEEDTEAADVLKHGKPKQLDVEPAPYIVPRDEEAEPQSPGSVASVPSEIEEPDESPIASNSNIASASFPSVPSQEPVVTEITENPESSEISRAPTPGSAGVNLPSVPKDNVDSSESKVRVGVTLSPGKHRQQDQVVEASKESLDEDMKRFLAKTDGSGVESGQGAQSQDTAPSLDAAAATISDPAGASRLAKSTSSSSTLSSSSTSSTKKKTQDRGRSPLLDMDVDGEDGGETGWAKVSVNKTKYS